MSSLPKCHFNYSTLIAKVGNTYKGFEELQCIQIPTFKRKVSEKEWLGNGWYGEKRLIEKVYNKYFIILKDNKPFGVLYNPYHEKYNIKSDIFPLDYDHPFKEIGNFIKSIV